MRKRRVILLFRENGEAWTVTPIEENEEQVLDKIVDYTEKRKVWCG